MREENQWFDDTLDLKHFSFAHLQPMLSRRRYIENTYDDGLRPIKPFLPLLFLFEYILLILKSMFCSTAIQTSWNQDASTQPVVLQWQKD